MNIRLPLFWSTWSRARGPDSATCAGLAHGRDYSDCRASELNLQKCLASVFLELSKILEKQWPAVGFFNPHPPDCLNPLIISFRLKTLNEWLHENLHQKSASWDALVICKIDFRHYHCIRKILGKVDGCQNIHHQEFWSHLANHEIFTVAERCQMTDLGCWMILLS